MAFAAAPCLASSGGFFNLLVRDGAGPRAAVHPRTLGPSAPARFGIAALAVTAVVRRRSLGLGRRGMVTAKAPPFLASSTSSSSSVRCGKKVKARLFASQSDAPSTRLRPAAKTVHRLSEPEDKPQVVLDDGGDLLVAWKPAKMSMHRQPGGGASPMEAWAAGAGLVAAATPRLGRGVSGLVLVTRRLEALLAAEALMGSACGAEVTLAAVVQGEPSEAKLAEAISEAEGTWLDFRVLEASEGLRFGRLSVVQARLQPGLGGGFVKEVRRRLAAIGHRVVGNGEKCARAAGVRRTHLAVVGLRLGDLVAEVPLPASFTRLLQKDAASLLRKGAEADWAGRTEHCNGEATFDGLELKVPAGVFVPRKSALHIVEAAASLPWSNGPFLDCGVGSGCILLALLKRFPHATGLGIDADPAAVAAASANAASCGFDERCEVRLTKFEDVGLLPERGIGPFSLVVSNPPYLQERVVQHILFARELQSQNSIAFAAGEDGLQAYQELAENLAQPGVLTPGAWLVMGCQPGKAAWAAGPFESRDCYQVHELRDQCAVLRFEPREDVG